MTTPQIAQGLAALGRNGDSMLMHVTPSEVAGLQSIAQANGTSLTINPDTGMPEAFSLGGVFRSLLPTVAGFLGAGLSGGTMSPMLAGILAGSATGALTNKKDPLMGAVMGGLGGYGGANLQQAATNFVPNAAGNTANQVVNQAGTTMEQAMLDPTVSKLIGGSNLYSAQPWTPAGITGSTGEIGANMGVINPSVSNTASTVAPTYGTQNQMVDAISRTADTGISSGLPQTGLQQAFNNVSQDPFGFVMQNKMGVGMPLGMAALSGIEPISPGMTEEEYRRQRMERFKGPLNLESGSRLNLAATGGEIRLATGGAVAFDDGGSVPGSKLNLRREEEQMAPMQVQPIQGAQPATINPAQQIAQPAETELGIAALKPGSENEVKIDIVNAKLDPMQQEAQQVQPLAARAQGEGIPQLMQELGGQGVDFEKLYGRTQAPAPMGPRFAMPASRGFGPDGRRLAAGGAIQSGGVMDLYQGTDSQPTFGGDQGYGLGRLSNLANQQSLARAEQGRFAKGGTPRLEDGGFVVPADVVFYLGNHNTEAGQKRLAKMYGAKPIKGKGTGLSDSIPTSIEGKEPAKIANGEAYIPRKVVNAHGGPKKFYDMMAKVRKKATGSTKQAKSA